MEIEYSEEAYSILMSLVHFTESENIPGAGYRFILRFESFLQRKFQLPKQYRICNNLSLQKLNLCCVYFNNWVIAFTIEEDTVFIESILHISRITD